MGQVQILNKPSQLFQPVTTHKHGVIDVEEVTDASNVNLQQETRLLFLSYSTKRTSSKLGSTLKLPYSHHDDTELVKCKDTICLG